MRTISVLLILHAPRQRTMQPLPRLAAATSFVLALLLSLPCSAQCVEGKLFASDAGAGDVYGRDVAVSASTAVVGASASDHGASEAGGAYVLRHTAGWSEAFILDPPAPQVQAFFGHSVGISDATAVVGAPFQNTTATDDGAAYVFDLPGGSPTHQALASGNPTTNGRFGSSVAISGDYAIIGANREDTQVATEAGAAYVFERDASGTWVLADHLFAPDGASLDRFGGAARGVAIDGSLAAVGAGRDDDQGTDSGSVYIYERTSFGWILDDKLTASNGTAGDFFGDDVEVSGERVAVGAPGAGSGAAYVFERIGSTWTEVAQLTAPSALTNPELFGYNVALDGDRLLVGDPLADTWGTDSGGAFLFGEQGGQWQEIGPVLAPDGQSGDQYGTALDIDSGRFVVGARGVDDMASDAGAVYVGSDSPAPPIFCQCDSGAPCGNGSLDSGCENSTGSGSRLHACGTVSVAKDDLVLRATYLPISQFGIVFMGATELDPAVVLGAGHRCIGGQLFRYTARPTGTDGSFEEGPGIVAFANSHFGGSGSIAAGDTWLFQAWYRDPLGPCATSNLTNGLSVTFEP